MCWGGLKTGGRLGSPGRDAGSEEGRHPRPQSPRADVSPGVRRMKGGNRTQGHRRRGVSEGRRGARVPHY